MSVASVAQGGPGAELVGVFVFALLVRIAFALATPAPAVMTDAAVYDRQARAIVAGQGYVGPDGKPTSLRPPLYSYFLAAVYRAFNNGRSIARLLQAILDAITCALVYALALRHFGAGAARVAAVLAVFSLGLLFATRHLLAETLGVFLMVATVFVLEVGLIRWRWAAFVAAGVLIGISTLTKGTTLLLPAAFMLPIWVAGRQWRRVLQAGVLLLLGFVITLLPWTIRNYRIHHEFVPVATQMGYVIYSSYVPSQGRLFGVYTVDETSAKAQALPEAERSRALLQAAVEHIREHPGELPRLILLKVLYFVSPFDWELLGGQGVFNFTYVLMLPFALYGVWLARYRGWRTLLLVTPPAFLLLLALALYGSPRLRLPAEPCLMVFAGHGMVHAWRRTEAQRTAFVAAMTVMLSLAFIAYVFSAEVKRFSADVLRAAGIW